MARKITISLSDEQEAQIKAFAIACGIDSIDECVEKIIAGALTPPFRAPGTKADIEAELLKGLEGPWITPDAEFWEKHRADLIARHSRNKAG